MSECQLVTNSKYPTFINVSGVDVSEIDDYFMHTNSAWPTSKRITDLPVNVSDHHPVMVEVECHISLSKTEKTENIQGQKIKWDKVDKEGYKEMITREMTKYI